MHKLLPREPRKPLADDLLKTADVAVWINRSAAWLDQGRMHNTGPPFVRIGRSIFYRRGDIQKWIKSQSNGRSRRTK